MRISWENFAVRVHAAEAWVSLAPRFAAEHPTIIDQLEACLADPVPAVRLQVARNLRVICEANPERMWALGERVARCETNVEVLMCYLNGSLLPFSHSEPERCEAILAIIKARLDADLATAPEGRNLLHESMGHWIAQLFAVQGRELGRSWLEEWAVDPQRFGEILAAFTQSLRGAYFYRYDPAAAPQARAMCERAQQGLALILTEATGISAEASAVLASEAAQADKQATGRRYAAAEKVIHEVANQLYFGSHAFGGANEEGSGLPDPAAKARFLADYAEVLARLATTREPATLHQLIGLYEFLIPGNPVNVFEAIHGILLGRGDAHGYQYESLGNTAVVRIVQRYLADHRAVFDDEGRRARLVEILQLFSDVGWPGALNLLYDLPELLR